jgi:hypothetical protein
MAGYEIMFRGRRMMFTLDGAKALQEFAHWESCAMHRGGAAELRGPDGETEIRSEWDGGQCVSYSRRGARA